MLRIEALLDEEWVVAKSGVSVDAGRATRIRQEAGCPREELQARARLISTAPLGYKLALAIAEAEQSAERKGIGDDVWSQLVTIAARLLVKGGDAHQVKGEPIPRKGRRALKPDASPRVAAGHFSSDGCYIDGPEGPDCGCQSCRQGVRS